jgi:hypothetical protein
MKSSDHRRLQTACERTRLFADGTIPAAFEVTESTVTSNGVIVVNYERAGAITSAS